MTMMGDWVGGGGALRQAMGIAEELSEDYDTTRAYVNLGVCLDEQGRLEEAAALALEGGRRADRLGMRAYAQFLQGEACWRLTRLGRFDDTDAIVERVLAEGPKGVAAIVLNDNAAHLAMRRGRLDDAVEHFQRARELLGGTSDSMWIGNQAAGHAETALWAADPERAWQLATDALNFVPEDQYAHYTTRLHATALRAAADRARRCWRPRSTGSPDGHAYRWARSLRPRRARPSIDWGSPSASSPSCRSWPRDTPTVRSARRCSSPRRPRACTCRGSWPSSACARAWRRRPRRTAWASRRPQRQATAGAGRRPSCSTYDGGWGCSAGSASPSSAISTGPRNQTMYR
jgi:tetratricopeptide (TPR) repeat protein